MSTRPTVYFHRACPFAHRAMIMVHEATHAYKDPSLINVVEVSLKSMPSWYRNDVNRREALPGLKLPDGTTYPESMLIAKYIDAAYLAPKGLNLLPTSPSAVAFTLPEMEAKIDAFMQIVWAMYGCLMTKDVSSIPERIAGIRAAITTTLPAVFNANGPFVYGSQFTMADVAIFPFILRFSSTLAAFCNFSVTEEFPVLKNFVEACLRRPSVASSSCPSEYYVGLYGSSEDYAKGKSLKWNYTLTVAEGDPFSERLQIVAAKQLAALQAKNKVAPAAVPDVAKEGDAPVGCNDESFIDYSFIKVDTVVVPLGTEGAPSLRTPHGRVVTGTSGITEYLLSAIGGLLAGGNVQADQLSAVSLRHNAPTPDFVSGFTTVCPAQAALSAAATIRGSFFADHNDGLLEGVGSDAIVSGDKSKLESKDGLSDVAKWNLTQMERILSNNAKIAAEGPFVFGKHISEFDIAMVPVLNRIAHLYGADAIAASAPKVAALLAAAKQDAIVVKFLKN